MGLLKLIIALVVIICIVVIVRDALNRRNKEKMVENLTDELDTINDSFVKTDLEIDVVDAKSELKSKRAVLAEKTDKLNTNTNTNTTTPPPGRVRKEGERPAKSSPKKKVVKKKAAKTVTKKGK